MILHDYFSGIGGFHLGFQRAGWKFKRTYFSEVDKYAIANYKYNFKDAEYVGPIENVSGGERPNVITFGSPCQDFSLAGKRRGLGGERSNLIQHAIGRIDHYKPDVFVWENVKGAFSSNDGADFWAIIQAFADIGDYRLEWQLLNTAWFLPQNRERIYLVGHLTGRSGAGVFPIGEDEGVFNKTLHQKGPKDQCVSTINVSDGKMNLETNYVAISSNTKSGFEIAQDYDGIRTDHLVDNSTGRGRVMSQVAHTIDTGNNHGVIIQNAIRSFTEIETERLQGFPDNWTGFGNFDGEVKPISRTQRYKMLGNAVSVPVVEEVARRILDKLNKKQ